ncbi:hypothetical protein R3P38DRAFT_2905629 [Favolaschia claudopus]|uniref:F-box domain-containing protein n=1 Tax=Favolaschia claudopus TaxID=2862362 RepID=A0AAW0CJG1_9AGAR
MITLPQELIQVIVGLVDDLDTLKVCALLCTALVPFVQRILLRSLTIQQIGSGRWRSGQVHRGVLSIQGAHSALRASPHISSYIRQLKIRFTGPPLKSMEEGPLESVLSALKNIEDLIIYGSSGAPQSPLASSSLLATLRAVLQLPSLGRFGLVNVDPVPHSFLSLAMVYSRVALLQNIGLTPGASNARPTIVNPYLPPNSRLERLVLQGSISHPAMASVIAFLVDSGNPPLLHRVRTLQVSMLPGSQAPAQRILAAVSPTLEHLVIDYGDCYRSRQNDALQLPLLPALSSIELTLFLGWVRRLPPDIYLTVSALPDAIPSIRCIRLVFVLDSLEQQVPWQDPSSVFPLFDTRREWRQRLPQLRQLDCRLIFSGLESNPQNVLDTAHAEFAASMAARFPGLPGTGILSFTRGVLEE